MTLHIADLLVGRPAFWGDSMTCRFGFMIAIAAALLAAPPAKAQAGGDVNGIWLTEAGDAKGDVSEVRGGIFWVGGLLQDPIGSPNGDAPAEGHEPHPPPASSPVIWLAPLPGLRDR